jgi:hypothetical protein
MLQRPNLSKKKVSSVINAEDTQKLAIFGSETKVRVISIKFIRKRKTKSLRLLEGDKKSSKSSSLLLLRQTKQL